MSKWHFDSDSRLLKPSTGWVIGIVFANLVLIVVALNYIGDTTNEREISGVVLKTYIKSYRHDKHNDDRYMVEIRRADGVIEVVQIRDSVFAGDWNSADKFAQLQPGQTVTVTVAGWRNGPMSLFPRVVSIK